MNIKELEPEIYGLSDQRLSLITNRAALEFDSASRGNPIGFESSKRLFSFLHSKIGDERANLNEPCDILTLGLVGESLLDISEDRKKTDLSEIVSELARLRESIESTEKTGDNRRAIEELRNFCVAFNRRIIAERSGSSSSHPSNPYKR